MKHSREITIRVTDNVRKLVNTDTDIDVLLFLKYIYIDVLLFLKYINTYYFQWLA